MSLLTVRPITLLALIACAILPAACSGESSTATTTQQTASEPPPPPPAAPMTRLR